jgi:hypothetical protein
LTQQADQSVAAVLARACIGENSRTCVGQAEGVIQLAIRQQPRIGSDRGTAKLQHQPPVEIEPQRTPVRFTRRVRNRRHAWSPQTTAF